MWSRTSVQAPIIGSVTVYFEPTEHHNSRDYTSEVAFIAPVGYELLQVDPNGTEYVIKVKHHDSGVVLQMAHVPKERVRYIEYDYMTIGIKD
jgi:hypothetical protein